MMLTTAEVTTWQAALDQWRRTQDPAELAEAMVSLTPDERAEVWALMGDCPARADVESLLQALNGRAG